jgi:hypothetical protein
LVGVVVIGVLMGAVTGLVTGAVTGLEIGEVAGVATGAVTGVATGVVAVAAGVEFVVVFELPLATRRACFNTAGALESTIE